MIDSLVNWPLAAILIAIVLGLVINAGIRRQDRLSVAKQAFDQEQERQRTATGAKLVEHQRETWT